MFDDRYRLLASDPQRAEVLGQACGIGKTAAQVLLHRGIDEADAAKAFLNPTLAGLTSPESMADRTAATERLVHAIHTQQKIVIFGDYDVDGTTSAAILSGIIEELGGDVQALCATRFEGYGLSDGALSRCLELKPSVLVTCDCGSSDHERIERANALGVDVIVVDHHLVPEEPLPALAFLNAHRPDCPFEYKGLASAGMALLLGAALRKQLDSKLDIRRWLDLVALGTVADVAPLDGDNRRLVRAGLKVLVAENARPGVVALRQIAKIPVGAKLTASDIAFRIAPLLNAPGRLGDAGLTLDLLCAKTQRDAQAALKKVHEINERRKELTSRSAIEAKAQVLEVYGAEPKSGVVVASKDWHRGVVGIVAARVAEEFGVPAVVVAFDGEQGHGSVRSYLDFDVYQALSSSSGELEKYGGHKAAAGLSMQRGRLDAFRAAFSDASRSVADLERPPTDVDIMLGSDFAIPSIDDLMALEPMGQGNPYPLFTAEAKVEQRRAVGVDGAHLSLGLNIAGRSMKAFAPNQGAQAASLTDSATVVGELRPDHYRGGDHIEMVVKEIG